MISQATFATYDDANVIHSFILPNFVYNFLIKTKIHPLNKQVERVVMFVFMYVVITSPLYVMSMFGICFFDVER